MDNIANKKIKITRNVFTITNKETPIGLGSKIGSIKGLLHNKNFPTTHHTKNHNLNPIIKEFEIKDLDLKDLEKKDKKYLGYITPLEPNQSTKKSVIDEIINPSIRIPFSAMDIETITFKGIEVPISVSIKTGNTVKLFMIDHVKLNNDLNLALMEFWDDFFKFILLNCNKNNIFVHNLGGFDGFFIYKALSNKFKPKEVSCLIDNHNKFIQITL